MGRRLTQQQVKDLFEKYGYILPDNFQYHNNKQKFNVYDEQNETHENLSLQQLRYRINRAATRRAEYFDKNLMNLPLSDNEPSSNDSYERWSANQPEEFNDLDDEYRHVAFDYYRNVMPIIARRQNTTLNFDQNDNPIPQLYGLVQALRTVDFSQFDVRLTLNHQGQITFAHANENTINFLYNSFFDVQDVGDSSNAILNGFIDVDSIHLEFIHKNNEGQRRAPGFFPFTHKFDGLNLSKYGIYRNECDIVNESCLITAFRASGLLNENQMKLLSSMIKTRHVLKSQLRNIAETFNLFIYVEIITNYENGKSSHDDYGDKSNPKLKLLIMYDHYLFNEAVITPFSKRKMSLFKVVKKLMDDNLLVPLSENIKKKLILSFNQTSDKDIDCDLCYRPLKIKDAKMNKYVREHRVKQTKRFFGYEPDNEEVDERLNELQRAIDTLPLRNHINVSDYYRFSELGQKILYETGCYDGVFELTGKRANDIRKTLKFPKTKIVRGEEPTVRGQSPKLYLNGEYYYLDINAAYMNFVKSIPSGIDNGYVNYRVGDVIRKLYELRLKAKSEGKNKLATTLKFIMNSTWGYSISRPKVIKHKYAQNPETYVQRFGKFILKHNGNFIDTVNCFVPHYTFPQFAKSVLDEYNKFFDEVKRNITVYYENVDALLTDKEGYDKLKEMGLIDDKEMGKFKVDKVFTEFAAISDRRYVATTIEGDRVFHCIKNMTYDNVVKMSKGL